MRAIAAVDEDWGIGRNGKLLVRIPGDQRFFREQTIGHTVIVGRKTFESFPHSLPLEGRRNVILTRNREFVPRRRTAPLSGEALLDEAVVVRDEDELYGYIGDSGIEDGDIWVIGGESVYGLLLPKCSEAYITRIDRRYGADSFFPNLEEDSEWERAAVSEEQVYFDTTYRFEKWKRKA